MLAGNLRVRPISAQFQHKKEIFDKADPYCKISIGNQVEKTDVCKNQSTNPSWSNTFSFNNVNLGSSILRFDIYDKNVLLDTSLGSAEVALNNLTQINNRFNGWIQLFHHNEVCGSLLIELEFMPSQQQMKVMDTGFQSYQPVYQSVSTTGGIPTTYSGEQQLGGFGQGYQQTTGLQGSEQLYGQQGYQQQSGQFLSGQQGYSGMGSQGLSSGSNLGNVSSGLSSGGYSSSLGTGYGQSGSLGYSGQQLGQQLGQQVGQGFSSTGISGLQQPSSYGQSMSQQLGQKVQQAGTSLGQSLGQIGQPSGQSGQFGTGYTQYKQ